MDSASSGNDAGIAMATRTFPESFHRLHRFAIDGPTFAVDVHAEFSSMDVEGLDVIAVPGGFAATYAFYAARGLRLGSLRFDSDARISVGIENVNLIRNLCAETNGRSVLAVFGDFSAIGVTLDANATRRKSEPAAVSIATVEQSTPVIASSGDHTLALWVEFDYPHGSVLLAQRRNANGEPIDAEPIVVQRGGIAGRPAIAFTGKV